MYKITNFLAGSGRRKTSTYTSRTIVSQNEPLILML